MKRIFVIIILICSSILSANAQSKKEIRQSEIITIPVLYPPQLGLKINKIAFGPASGNCADQIIDAIMSDFVTNNIEVIDRENLNTILAEHNFTFSGYIDQTSASAIGKILGPSAMIFIKIQRCTTQVDNLVDKKKVLMSDFTYKEFPLYITRTRAFLKGSIQAVDLTSGKIFSAKTFDMSPEESNSSIEGRPEAPSEFDLQDLAIRQMVWDVHKLFLPYKENLYAYYFDDKKYNLKAAYDAIEAGNLDLAFELSLKNLDECKNDTKADDKSKSHAYYNVGISYLTKFEFEKALEYFKEVEKLNPGEIVTHAINSCNTVKKLMAEMQKVEEKASLDLQKSQAEVSKAVQADQASTLSNSDIIDLTKKKLPKSLIIQKIKTSKCNFDTSTDALIVLTNAGVSEDVIILMMEKK